MNVRIGACLVLMCAWGAVAQQQQGAGAAGAMVMKPAEKLEPARAANTNGIYQALRGRTPNGAVFAVKNMTLKRDAGLFTFSDGTFYLFSDVNGMTTGAVFVGDGTLHVEPPSAMEKKRLKLMMKTEVLEQPFTSAVFEFTDGTAAELQKASTGTGSGNAASQMQDAQTLFRKNLKYNVEGRLLEDVLQPGSGGFFLAEMKGPLLSKRLIYVVDPHGAIGVEPEEVALLTSLDDGYDVTLGFRSEAQRGLSQATDNAELRIAQQTIDLTIERNGKMTGTVVSAITAVTNGVQALPLDLFPTLRVSGVWGPNGEALDFIQEDKDRDADLMVVLPHPLKAGEMIQLTTSYSGKDVVWDMGLGNYYLVAREDWYPNVRASLGNYAQYHMTFHTAKNIQVVATGNRIADKDDGGRRTSEWQTMVPIAVASFNLGEFKSNVSEHKSSVQVISYGTTSVADDYSSLTDITVAQVGWLSTVGTLKKATLEGDAAIQIYTDYFGPIPYDHVYLTQQTGCHYGHSWPMLVSLPTCYFWDNPVKHEIGVPEPDPTYWKVVTANEVAHQWWGQTVGFKSYRNQWMSEGFADFSAAVYLRQTRKDPKESRDFWVEMRKRLLEKNKEGFRPVDAGPVVMGTQVSNLYQSLIGPKGAYILYMLEGLYSSPQTGNQPFKAAMHDFVQSYQNKSATTEDFKAVMERNMPPWLDIDKNHRLDWFFDAYVYGTGLPKYTISTEFSKDGDRTIAHMKLTQAGVPDNFRMLVPLYLEMPDKRIVMIGRAPITGSKTLEEDLNLGKLPTTPLKMMANYGGDLLSEPD